MFKKCLTKTDLQIKTKLFLSIVMISFSVSGIFAQTKIVYGGLSFPNGDFGDDDYGKNIISKEGKLGGAGLGFGVGFKYLQPLSIPNLNWFVSAEFNYNGLKSSVIDDAEDDLTSQGVDINTIDIKYPKYFNIPVMAGVNYSLAELSPGVVLFLEGGLGVNCRFISDFAVEQTDGNYELEYDFDNSFTFAYQIGGGLKIQDKYIVALNYYGLGSDKLR